MREILFRGKRMDNGAWVEGAFCMKDCDDPFGEMVDRPSVIKYEDPCSGFWFRVNPETVGQYTGLTDKNGKKIFEGDIIEYNDGFDYFIGEVVFENGAFGIGCDEVIGISNGCSDNFANLWQLFWDQEVTDEPELYYCIVIGNIHDNPELIGGKGNA